MNANKELTMERTTRYEVRAIADADCTRVHDEVLASTDDATEAKRLAAENSRSLYGAAVVDTETGAIDFGS